MEKENIDEDKEQNGRFLSSSKWKREQDINRMKVRLKTKHSLVCQNRKRGEY